MNASPAADRTSRAEALAALHAARTPADVERATAALLARILGGVGAALCIASDDAESWQLRAAVGQCPWRASHRVSPAAGPAADQRLPVRWQQHVLGELWLEAPVDADVRAQLDELLVHFGTAIGSLALHAESQQATANYCASLQALEQGIVLFQESDPAAVTARLLGLASSMVQASAGALYMLQEVGDCSSGLRLAQALGIPEALLASLRTADGRCWADALLDQPVHLAVCRPADSAGDGTAGDGTAGDGTAGDGALALLDAKTAPAALRAVLVLPLRYHGVQAGVCLLFNPEQAPPAPSELLARLQSFGQLAAALLHRLSLEALAANSVMMARELEIAATIQRGLVPSAAPDAPEFDFAWSTVPAKRIGGDYVDLLTSDRGDVYAVVADASGHGINSALLTTSFRANYRGRASELEPGAAMGALNDDVVREVGATGMFVTAVHLRLARATRQLSLCSAGHPPSLVWRAASGALELVGAHGPALGFVAGAGFACFESRLAPGDVLLLHTDGVTEACDGEGAMFGDERLHALLRDNAAAPAAAIVAAVHEALVRFAEREHHDDDVSLVVIKAR